jgi:hypothetical protein
MLSEPQVESLLEAFFATPDSTTSLDPVTIVSEHHRRQRRTRIWVGAVLATAVLLAISLPLALVGNGPSRLPLSGPSVHLSSFTFHLPSAYRLDAHTSECHATATLQAPFSTSSPQIIARPYSSEVIASDVAQQGGCLAMAISNPYTKGANGDPFEVEGSQAISIKSYSGWVYTQTGPGGAEQVNLGVAVPDGSDVYRDIVVGTLGLPLNTVESIVASGLSPSGS